jgi:hypothetical protein
MIAASSAKPVTIDDVNSFVTRIDSAEIALSAKSLEDLLNGYVFAYPGAPLKKIAITMERGRLKQKGVMHKGIDVPFEVEGTLDVTSDGEIRFHADKVRSAHIPFKGLMHLFGEDLAKLINLQIVDQSPSTPFDFSLPDYNRQLVAGYSKNTPTNGLIVFMPDLAALLRSNR